MTIFDIDFRKLITEILPPKKRRRVRVTWLFRLMAWFRRIHAEFIALHERLNRESKVTSQVIVLESYLIDTFGAGITITPTSIASQEAYIKADQDNDFGLFVIVDNTQQHGGAYITESNDASIYNFTVEVPTVLNADLDRMRAILNKYKITGSTYIIILI